MLHFTDSEYLVWKQRLNKHHLEVERRAASRLFVVSALMHVSNYLQLLKCAHKNVTETQLLCKGMRQLTAKWKWAFCFVYVWNWIVTVGHLFTLTCKYSLHCFSDGLPLRFAFVCMIVLKRIVCDPPFVRKMSHWVGWVCARFELLTVWQWVPQ